MLFSFFSKITWKQTISDRMEKDQPIYLYLLFPIAFAFLLTFSGARLISHYNPLFFLHIVPGLHIHHYSYGFLVLAASGYLALVNNSAHDTYLISLLHGFGLGLAFDEFGIWLRLSEESTARFSYDGVVILAGLFFLIISAEAGVKAWKVHVLKKPARSSKKQTIITQKETVIETLDTPLTFEGESDTM